MSARDPAGQPGPHPQPERPSGERGGMAVRLSFSDLMLAFAKTSLIGFGGVLPWFRRMLVDEKRWMTAEQFNKLFAVCQFLPGPNVVNMSAVLGLRLYGVLGAIAALMAMAGPPVAVMIGVGMLYARYGGLPGVSGALAGLAAGVAGMMIATAARMARPLFSRRLGPAPVVAAATFVAIGFFRLPLIPVLAVLTPVSIALAWWVRR